MDGSSGKWTIYFLAGSVSHGHGTSAWPGLSGAPTECMQGINVPLSPSLSSTALPMRVIMRMITTTYGESEISIPILQIGESNGPIANGMTYIVLPAMQFLNMPRSFSFISAGSAQLLVGPAWSLVFEEI